MFKITTFYAKCRVATLSIYEQQSIILKSILYNIFFINPSLKDLKFKDILRCNCVTSLTC